MKIDFNKKEYKHDLTGAHYDGVQLNLTASEYLVIISAIRQFAENSANHSVDIETTKSMIEEIEKDIKESEAQLL